MIATSRRWKIFAAWCLLSTGTLFAATTADDIRFSATLRPGEFVSLGFNELNADNLAVIDGLVRQDEAASKFKNNGVDHTRFSQRRSVHEREIAGLTRLKPEQLAELDELVRRRIAGPEPESGGASGTLVSPPARGDAVRMVTGPRPIEIHGEVSYTLGWSKAGSFQGGDIVLGYEDPARRFSVVVGYSEYHGKGLPWCVYPDAGPYRYRALGDPLMFGP
ncbi:MAG: hypothetical protein JWM32_1115 [Verrucomicrobia bacterium]|nr:hypothetical protein [Verrucomicrobiota bacterium]